MITHVLDSVMYLYLVKQKSKFYSKHPGKRPTAGGEVGKHFRILVLGILVLGILVLGLVSRWR